MNKDFWERINRLEELASKATQGEWFVEMAEIAYCGGDVMETYITTEEREKSNVQDIAVVNNAILRPDKTPTDIQKEQNANAHYIAAANPAMIMEMIDELKRLDDENYNLKCELSLADEDAYNMEQDCKRSEKEADCLATFLADICDYVADTDCCPVAEACVCPRDKCKDANKPEIWREKASELVELRTEADNA